MANVNYSLKHKGVRLIPSEKAWVKGKTGKVKLNPEYHIVGKIDARLPNIIVSPSDKRKLTYKGNTYDLCRPAKSQIVSHFFNSDGKRNRNRVAYFGIKKEK